MIIYENDSDILKTNLIDILYNTIKDSEPIYTQTDAYKFLALQTKGKNNITHATLSKRFLHNT